MKKHKCPYCDALHERAGDAMTHITRDHADEVAFKPFAQRGYRPTARQEPCPKCGVMMMPSLVSGCPCGYSVKGNDQDEATESSMTNA